MSVSGKRGVGLPIILLHDAEGGIVTVELKSGDSYRGYLEESQDNMNLTMKNCQKTTAAGKQSTCEVAYIRGAHISFVVIPNMLAKAPFFNRIKLWRKFKGHAVMGTAETGPLVRGQSAAIIQKSRERRMMTDGAGAPPPGSLQQQMQQQGQRPGGQGGQFGPGQGTPYGAPRGPPPSYGGQPQYGGGGGGGGGGYSSYGAPPPGPGGYYGNR